MRMKFSNDFHKVLAIVVFCLIAVFLFPIHPIFFWIAAAIGVYVVAMEMLKKFL